MIKRLLIANRGEIAIRISRTATDLGVATVAIYAEDDDLSLHTRHADESVNLETQGVAAYLNSMRIIQIAKDTGCDAIHPGYGFLSESAEFAQACEEADLIYVGPTPATLKQFGDKAAARSLAEQCDVPVLPGISRAVTRAEASGIMLKAIAGGGGRGMRPVFEASELEEAFARASSEAATAFGSGDLYVEELLPRARHIEVQIVGDGGGRAVHLWDRECSLQRQRQKVIEIAPAFDLPETLRETMLKAAVRMAGAANYRGVGTIEFLIDKHSEAPRFVFL